MRERKTAGSETGSLRACASILSAAFLWGMIGLWNRNLMAGGFSPATIVAVRNLGGMLLLILVFLLKDRSVFQIQNIAHLKYFAGTGIVSVVFFTLCYFSCQKLCSLSIASILLYTAPSIVVLLSAILWKEPITKRKILALILTLIGCALVCGVFSDGLRATIPGILLGLGAGFFYALYSIFARYALVYYDAMTVTVWTFIFAGPASLFFIKPTEIQVAITSPKLLGLSVCLIVLSTVLPYILYTRGLSRIEAGRASIMASLEPVVASLAGAIFFQESIGWMTLIGILCVLAGVVALR